jgi:hypothetical protein
MKRLLFFASAIYCVLPWQVAGQPAAGTYTGLFYESAKVAQPSSGSITLSLTPAGAFSGRLQLGARRVSLSGAFGADGRATVTINTASQIPLDLELQSDNANRLTGTLTDGTWLAALSANRAAFDGVTKVAPQAGRYTLVIPAKTESNQVMGDGFGIMTVDKAGRINLSGSLADGAKFSYGTVISSDGKWPLYVPLYRGQGVILSWVNFDTKTTAGLDGSLNWIKAADPKAKYYAAGFTNQVVLTGSAFQAPARGEPLMDFVGGEMVLAGGNLPAPLRNFILIDDKGRMRNLSPNRLRVTFTPTSGAFRGTVTDPASLRAIAFGGVILQNQNRGAGFFLGADQSGSARLQPVAGDIVDLQTVGSSFMPEVFYDATEAEAFSWAWSDNTASTASPLATKRLGSRRAQHQFLAAYPGGALTSINIGFDASDGGQTTPLTNRPQQNVSSVYFPYPLTGLKYWASSYNPITNTLDFSGFNSLEAIECFHCTNLEHVSVSNLPALKRVCFENCSLQELDLSGNPNLADVRAALNDFPEVKVGGGTGPKIWHWCIRDNPQLTQDFAQIMTNFYSLQELWIWHANQQGALTVVSTNLTDVEVEGNQYTYANFQNQPNLQTCWIYDNRLTNLVLTGCVGLQDLQAQNNQLSSTALDELLTVLDTSCPNLRVANLSQNPQPPSLIGYTHYSSLTNRGVTVYLDGQ